MHVFPQLPTASHDAPSQAASLTVLYCFGVERTHQRGELHPGPAEVPPQVVPRSDFCHLLARKLFSLITMTSYMLGS